MEVEYSLTMDDLLAFHRYHFENSPTLCHQRLINLLVVPVVSLILLLILFGVPKSLSELLLKAAFFTPIWVPATLLWLIFYPWYWRRRAIRMSEQTYREGRNERVWGRRRLSITEDAITVTTEVGTKRLLKKVAVAGLPS